MIWRYLGLRKKIHPTELMADLAMVLLHRWLQQQPTPKQVNLPSMFLLYTHYLAYIIRIYEKPIPHSINAIINNLHQPITVQHHALKPQLQKIIQTINVYKANNFQQIEFQAPEPDLYEYTTLSLTAKLNQLRIQHPIDFIIHEFSSLLGFLLSALNYPKLHQTLLATSLEHLGKVRMQHCNDLKLLRQSTTEYNC